MKSKSHVDLATKDLNWYVNQERNGERNRSKC